jgi:hypothetical protein
MPRKCRTKPTWHSITVTLVGTPLGRSWLGKCQCGEYVYAISPEDAWAWFRGIGCAHSDGSASS